MVKIRDVTISKRDVLFLSVFPAGVMTEVSPSAFNESIFALYITFHFYYIVLLLQSIALLQYRLGRIILVLNIFIRSILASGKR